MKGSVLTVTIAAIVGALSYLAAWLCVGFTWHWLGLLGGALAFVCGLAAIHVAHYVYVNGFE